MSRKAALIFFIISLGAIAIMALFLPFSGDSVALFQKQHVDATLLNSGETGKILKHLKKVLPLENKSRNIGFESNVVEVIGRASKDFRKWTHLDQYKKYRKKGIFCYLEMQTEGNNFPVFVLSKKDKKWLKDFTFDVGNNNTVYAFFLDSTGAALDLNFIFFNTDSSVTINTMTFLQKGYHPLVYSDQVALSGLLSDIDRSAYEFERDAVVLKKGDKNKHLKASLRFKDKWMVGVSKFQKKQGGTQMHMTPTSMHPLAGDRVTDKRQLAEASKGKLPVLSIDAEEEDLYSDEYGIIKNYAGHGRGWERLSLVRLFREGEEILSTFSGIRLQGGDPGRAKGLINFRLFFREEYGRSRVDGDTFFNEPVGDIKRLAIKQSEWEKWPLNTPLAYETSRKIGALAPVTELVKLYLNGKEMGLYYLVPHLGETQVELMLPKGEYQYYRHRGSVHHADNQYLHSELWGKIGSTEKLTEEYANQFFDLDNLSKQLFSYAFNATGDYCQGLVLKGTKPDSKMFWYSWDMDHSFIDVSHEVTKPTPTPPHPRWEQPFINEFFAEESEDSPHYCPRVHLFRRLVNEDPAYRLKARDRFMEFMNHRVTNEFLSQLIANYGSKLEKANYPGRDEYLSILRDFFSQRKEFLIKELETYIPSPVVQTCTVTSDKYPVSVDDYLKTGAYEGAYFLGTVVRLQADDNQDFQHWLIDGKKIVDRKTEFIVAQNQDCRIRAVFR